MRVGPSLRLLAVLANIRVDDFGGLDELVLLLLRSDLFLSFVVQELRWLRTLSSVTFQLASLDCLSELLGVAALVVHLVIQNDLLRRFLEFWKKLFLLLWFSFGDLSLLLSLVFCLGDLEIC